ncbi:hypothetical protein [Variovorax terrae]|uniref:DUF1223 domain-containing protein n=1 Tax=Variovorax terrae TaxID=2923278 RepID=A0A9X1VXT1_9BURK|nr:hypothetical protein [Variovorax terrae]MCJ0764144.1 hypothetical protein [Variovorax terrae]
MKPSLFLLGLAVCLPPPALAQSFCASDGQRAPVALVERFISADCEACWSDARSARPGPRELAIDWIVPSARGDDAPLSAAATRDSLARLEALGQGAPQDTARLATHAVGAANGRRLRVAHGLPFNDYIGTSIEMKPGTGGPWRAWLLLVETIPAGTEGTPVPRNLVRNMLMSAWDGRGALSKSEQAKFVEWRPMSIPEGANPGRLRVVGWVEDARGRVVAAAQSHCPGGH